MNYPIFKMGYNWKKVFSITLCFVLMAFFSNAIAQNQRTISGTILDPDGETIIGVNIVIKGTTTGTVSDINGSYELTADSDETILVFSFIGFKTIEARVGTRTTIDITLEIETSTLDEIVVTGYGTQKKIDLTGAVGVVTAEEIATRPITKASQALQGRIAGVWINQNSGEPGQDGAIIRIRGIGTLNDPNPLILVDGIEAPIDNINPIDIESITVLKDAASAAIYGSRAAHGVVLVTTKSGSKNKKATFNYSNFIGSSEATNLPEMITNSGQFMELRNEAWINNGSPAPYTAAQIADYKSNGPNTDWITTGIGGSATIQQHNLSVSGGSATTNFNLSGGYLNQKSYLENVDGAKRYNLRLNLDTDITDNFKIGTRLSFSKEISNLDDISQDGGVLERLIRQTPNFPAFLPNDNTKWAQRELGFPEFFGPNPLAEIFSEQRDSDVNRFLGNLYAEWEIIKNLKVRGTVGINSQTGHVTIFHRRADMYDWRSGNFIQSENQNRFFEEQFSESINLTTWLTATYNLTKGDNDFNFMLGFNQETSDQKWFGASRTNLVSNSLPSLNTGNPESSANYGGGTAWSLRSLFARINYNYGGRYLFEFNIRRDGSSRFGDANRWANFPSVSAGWVLSQEQFMANSGLFDFLKIRASWGQLGNQNIGDFPSAALVSFSPTYNFGGTIYSGAAQTTLGNEDIKWETTSQFDLGLDLEMLGGRLFGEFDYFVKNTHDILFDQPNPAVTGVRTPTTRNLAEVQNIGWETLLGWRDSKGSFSYDISFNLTHVKTEVIKIDPEALGDADRVFEGDFILQAGSPINAIYGLEMEGIFQNQGEIDGAPDQSGFGTPTPGDLKYRDINGDGVITVDDRTVIGKEDPTWIYGVNAGMGYKGFDFSLMIQGVGDMQTYGSGNFFVPFNNSAGLAAYWLDRWTPSNPSTTMPKLAESGGISTNVTNSFWVEDRSFWRLKNVMIGYTFPSKWMDSIFINSFRIFVNGQNLFTQTDYKGFDPERATRQLRGGYPQNRIISAGLELNF